MTCFDAMLTEFHMGNSNGHPVNNRRNNYHRKKIHEYLTRKQIIHNNNNKGNARGNQSAGNGNSPMGKPVENSWCISLVRQAIKHTGIAVNSGIIHRNSRRQHHQIENMSCRWNTYIIKNLHKRTGLHANLIPRPQAH